jgi:glucose-6-phosphate isomerase
MKLWEKLAKSADQMRTQNLNALFSQDANRVQKCALNVDQIYLDYSKNLITPNIMAELVELAQVLGLPQAIAAMFQGECINNTESKPALHTALRLEATNTLMINGVDVVPNIRAQKAKMKDIVEHLRAKRWLGATGVAITDVVNIGIGGSDLGPHMATQALQSYHSGDLQCHFISNVDPQAIVELLAQLNPATTLFIISSKSFTTPETLTNTAVAREWLTQALPNVSLDDHFIAVTAQYEKAKAFGIKVENILTFEPWVGGRYSIWSTIGLPLALSIGMEHFESFLQGARAMDRHFAHAPLSENMPVILALLGIWYVNFWDAATIAVLPYAHALRKLADYLQQLDMESNGKQTQKNGQPVTHSTGPIVWGQAGTNGQHAFYQLLHQGTHFIPIDFILVAKGNTKRSKQHLQLVANGLAQAQALMQGSEEGQAYERFPGNKPSNTLLLSELTPYSFGQLLALYEHKVYVQGVIWQINSFDQPGVELGKKLANKIEQSLESGKIDTLVDASTRSLIEKIRATAC